MSPISGSLPLSCSACCRMCARGHISLSRESHDGWILANSSATWTLQQQMRISCYYLYTDNALQCYHCGTSLSQQQLQLTTGHRQSSKCFISSYQSLLQTTWWWKNFDDLFIPFDTTDKRDKRTNTAWLQRPRLMPPALRGKKMNEYTKMCMSVVGRYYIH